VSISEQPPSQNDPLPALSARERDQPAACAGADEDCPALLICLPGGLYVSGVVTWAVALVNALASRNILCGLVVHQTRRGYASMIPALDPRVRVHDLSILGDFESSTLEIAECKAAYSQIIEMYAAHGPVVVVPNLHGDCYGAAAAACSEHDNAAMVGWCHLDSPYDLFVLKHYDAAFTRLVGVSSSLAARLAATHGPDRTCEIGYGVAGAPPDGLSHESLGGQDSYIKIAYAGRLEKAVKRIDVLPIISELLTARGRQHNITITGDGPDAHSLPRDNRNIIVSPAQPPEALCPLLTSSDVFVLPSRAEGLSLAMLQAMRCGAVPVVTSMPSGAVQVISHGENGYLIEPHESAHVTAERFAACIDAFAGLPAQRRAQMREAAVRAAEPYSMKSHAERVIRLLCEAGAKIKTRSHNIWPGQTPWNFTGLGGAVVGPGAAQRLIATLISAATAGKRIAIYGTGNHTQQLRGTLLPFIESVACFIDDNPRDQYLFGRPVYTLCEAKHQLRDDGLIIISSRIHAHELLLRAQETCPLADVIALYPLTPVTSAAA
jgi:glycosyltransferase involved in cell wall biosynthesis